MASEAVRRIDSLTRVVSLRFWFWALLVCASCNRPAPDIAARSGYRVRLSMPLSSSKRSALHLQLLEDERITPAFRAGFDRGLPDDRCDAAVDNTWTAFCEEIHGRPLQPALVRIVDATGRELDTSVVERPIADLTMIGSSREHRLYAVFVDLSAEAGSYSGPYARLLDPGGQRLEWIRARDPASGRMEEVHLATTPKSAWQAIARHDGGIDLLMVACRPSLDSATGDDARDFRTSYVRYSIENGEWRRHERAVAGLWENEGVFPVRSLFP